MDKPRARDADAPTNDMANGRGSTPTPPLAVKGSTVKTAQTTTADLMATLPGAEMGTDDDLWERATPPFPPGFGPMTNFASIWHAASTPTLAVAQISEVGDLMPSEEGLNNNTAPLA